MDLFDIAAKITLDTSDYEKDLAGAEKSGSGFADKLKKGLGTAAKVGAAALAAGAAAVTSFVKKSIDEYANFEQLVGGIETLFKNSADVVRKYADNAYKTAGLSANEYMETVTSFSASLLQSLGGDTEKAAQYADVAITDMSDNANKMGTAMESIQAAYQGFAKQNYTMLDNLKLGYGGTKEEMLRLVADAQNLDSSFKANTETVVKNKKEVEELAPTYADIVQAIHIVQTEMGITGTTAKEASTTIQGSISSMKAAWHNLLVGIADENADFEGLVGNLASSVSTTFKNLIPRVKQALRGVTQLVSELGPIIADELPGIVNNVLPEISKVAVDLILTLANSIVENLPMLVETGISIIGQIVTAIGQALPELIPAAISMILQIVDALLSPEGIDQLIDAAIALVLGLAEGLIRAIPLLISKVPEILEKLVSAIIRNAPKLLSAAWELIKMFVRGIGEALGSLWEAGKDIVNKVGEGIASLWEKVKNWGKDVIEKVKNGIMEKIDGAKQWGKDMIQNFIDGITEKAKKLIQKVKDIASSIKDFLGFSEPEEGPLSDFHTYAPDMMNLFMKGITDNKRRLQNTVADAFDFGDSFTAPTAQRPAFAAAGAGAGGNGFCGNIALYIDGDKLVGATSRRMDRDLGNMQQLKARWGGRN